MEADGHGLRCIPSYNDLTVHLERRPRFLVPLIRVQLHLLDAIRCPAEVHCAAEPDLAPSI